MPGTVTGGNYPPNSSRYQSGWRRASGSCVTLTSLSRMACSKPWSSTDGPTRTVFGERTSMSDSGTLANSPRRGRNGVDGGPIMTTLETTQHKMWVSPELKADITAHWRINTQYTSESAMLREIIQEIATNGVDEEQLASFDSIGKANVKIWVTPETWDAAMKQAEASGLSLSSVIRRRVMKMMGYNGERHAP